MSVLAVIVVLAMLIVVHELGHFMAARLQGIYVNRFSIGFGPILWKYQGKETEYALRAIPLGGFVGFPDDDPNSPIPEDDPDLLSNRPIIDRAIVISAGVIANLIFAYVVLALQFGLLGIPEGLNYEPGVLIPQVISNNAPAARAGIEPGDLVLAVAERQLPAAENATQLLMDAIQSHPNQPLALKIQRGDKIITLSVTPKVDPDGTARIGVQLIPNGTPIYRSARNPVEILGLAARQFQVMFVGTAKGFGRLILHFRDTVGQVASPVKIVEQGAGIAKSDASSLFPFAAIISINLAIINILPLPALDGGQLAFLLIEGLRGKPLPARIQDGVMQTGLVLLLGLGIFLIVRDTTQLNWIQNLFQ